jgi:RNA polymerase sigma-70 factor (ECF subfamily)
MMRVKEGDTGAFRRLFDKYKGPVMGYLQQSVSSHRLAEELTQETFLKIYRARESYEPRASFASWLWTIARNQCLDHLRKRGEVLLDGTQEGDDSPGAFLEQVADVREGAEELLLQAATRSEIDEALAGIARPQREALLLRTMGELSYQEIADQLGVTVLAVKSLIVRAKTALAQRIGEGKSNG